MILLAEAQAPELGGWEIIMCGVGCALVEFGLDGGCIYTYVVESDVFDFLDSKY